MLPCVTLCPLITKKSKNSENPALKELNKKTIRSDPKYWRPLWGFVSCVQTHNDRNRCFSSIDHRNYQKTSKGQFYTLSEKVQADY